MKKILALLLIGATVVALFCGCQANKTNEAYMVWHIYEDGDGNLVGAEISKDGFGTKKAFIDGTGEKYRLVTKGNDDLIRRSYKENSEIIVDTEKDDEQTVFYVKGIRE